MKLLAKIYQPDVDVRGLENLVSSQVGLTVRLLRLASSAALTRASPIGTVQQAILRVGLCQLAAMIVLIMVSGLDDKPIELARQALVRARMCEALARGGPAPADELFTAGLLSLLDALLDRPLAELLAQLPLTHVIRDALGTEANAASCIVGVTRNHDRGDFAQVEMSGFAPEVVFKAWREAIVWADELIALL
jgi:EAL and modified HD-GYP domain-containing signal transduction protein